MESSRNAQVWLRHIAVGVLVLALLGGMWLPLYTDEVGWRLHERAAFDGVDKMYTLLCGPNTVAHPPFWMMPARYYSALFNGLFAEPFYVRVSGVIYALAWTGMLLALIRRVAEGIGDRIVLTTLAAGFLSLGTLPLLLVWSRPEQPIILALTGAVLVATRDWRRAGPDTPASTAWLRSLAIVVLASIAMSYHVKALITVPLFLVCLFVATRGRQAHIPRLVVGLVLTALAAWATYYWAHRLQCPASAVARAEFTRINSGAALVGAPGLSQLLHLVGQALGNISLFHYLGLATPRLEPMSVWLPSGRISTANSFIWFMATIGIWLSALIVAAGSFATAARRGWRERKLDSRIALSVTLLGTILAWSATQGVRNDYEASFVVPMAVMALLLALAPLRDNAWLAGGVRVVSVSVGLLGLVSVALVAAIYGPFFATAARERGYTAEQTHSVGVFGYAEQRRDMLKAAGKCGITDPDNNRALLIDDVTYFTFMKSRRPEHAAGLFTPWSSNIDPIDYLRAIKSDGIIVSCRVLPPDLRGRAKREGQFCCLAPPNW